MSSEPIVNQPFLYANGMTLAYSSTTAFTVTAGQCRDSTNVFDINVGNFLGNGVGTANATTTVNTAVNGVNGLDTGTLAASTGYYVYAIGDPSDFKTPAYIMSLNAPATGPVMPFNYGTQRCIGWVLTDSMSHILKFYQGSANGGGRYFQWDAPISVLSGGTATTYTAMDLSVAMPSVQFGRVVLQAAFTPNAASDTAKFQPTGATGDWLTITGQVAAVVIDESFSILPLLATAKPEVSYKLSTASAALTVVVEGYDFQI
jgi:hypothetical protein